MSDAGSTEYVPDRLYERLFQPWKLPPAEWPLCKEDWARVDAITALPWHGKILDFGAGDGTLAAMVLSRNPDVRRIQGIETDGRQIVKAHERWKGWALHVSDMPLSLEQRSYDGALCCEVLEHLTPEDGHRVLCDLKRVLKPGAMLCVTVPIETGSRADYPGHVRFFGADAEFVSIDLTNAGFQNVTLSNINRIWLMAVAHA